MAGEQGPQRSRDAGEHDVDSAGIGELVACYKRAIEAKGVIKLVNPASKVQDLLALTKLDEYFETYPSEAEALASFAS